MGNCPSKHAAAAVKSRLPSKLFADDINAHHNKRKDDTHAEWEASFISQVATILHDMDIKGVTSRENSRTLSLDHSGNGMTLQMAK